MNSETSTAEALDLIVENDSVDLDKVVKKYGELSKKLDKRIKEIKKKGRRPKKSKWDQNGKYHSRRT